MAHLKKIEQHLTTNKADYEVVPHRTVFTAYDLAATLKEKLENIGKTLLVKADKKFVLVLLPAHRRLDLAKLKKHLNVKKIVIAKEKEMAAALKIKPGALTAFGSLHNVEVVADKAILKAKHLLFGTGSFTESIRMKARDFLRIENPTTADISSAGNLPSVPVAKKPVKKHRKGTGPKKNKKKK